MVHINDDEQFWYNNLNELIKKDHLSKLIPNKNFTSNENLNTIVRLSILLTLFLVLFTNDINYIVVILSTLIITYFIHGYRENIIIENLEEEMSTVYPTINNPFMNISPDEYLNNLDRKVPKDLLTNKKLQNEIERSFDHNLYKDASDIFNRNNSQRQFYTMPVTTIPNKQKKFAEWLYKTPTTCKEGNGLQCVANLSNGGAPITRGPIPQNL